MIPHVPASEASPPSGIPTTAAHLRAAARVLHGDPLVVALLTENLSEAVDHAIVASLVPELLAEGEKVLDPAFVERSLEAMRRVATQWKAPWLVRREYDQQRMSGEPESSQISKAIGWYRANLAIGSDLYYAKGERNDRGVYDKDVWAAFLLFVRLCDMNGLNPSSYIWLSHRNPLRGTLQVPSVNRVYDLFTRMAVDSFPDAVALARRSLASPRSAAMLSPSSH